APRQLLVVSSDHRLHRAARRRRAQAIDSDRWYAETVRRRRELQRASATRPSKPASAPAEDEVDYWLAQFADETLDEQANAEAIFPPGYGEDIEENV
ncbi:MAG TPA: hypothetical protein VMV59_04235, partial [Candidatus Dormibacteraeota bacterium]|nr:hypothetical protein [Candidatus Dormibacteraeota bacterium]